MKQRRIDLDVMRIIACFLVIFNHLPGYGLYGNTDTALKSWIYMFPTMITRINVPLFFMISGTLLLTDRQEIYKKIITKRFLRIAYVLLIFTAVLYFTALGNTFMGWNFNDYFRAVLAEPSEYGGGAYWYLYCYLGFLLLLPLLRRIANGMTKQDFILLLLIHFIFSSLMPVINMILGAYEIPGISISGNFSGALNLANSKVMFYPLIGFYIDHKVDMEKMTGKKVALMMLAGLVGIVISNTCTYYQGTHSPNGFTQDYVQLFDYLTTICAFVLIKYIVLKLDVFEAMPKFSNIVSLTGRLTFGIYLMDPIWKKLFYRRFEAVLEPLMITILVSVLWCLTSMCLGGIVTFVLKRIPGFRELL